MWVALLYTHVNYTLHLACLHFKGPHSLINGKSTKLQAIRGFGRVSPTVAFEASQYFPEGPIRVPLLGMRAQKPCMVWFFGT